MEFKWAAAAAAAILECVRPPWTSIEAEETGKPK